MFIVLDNRRNVSLESMSYCKKNAFVPGVQGRVVNTTTAPDRLLSQAEELDVSVLATELVFERLTSLLTNSKASKDSKLWKIHNFKSVRLQQHTRTHFISYTVAWNLLGQE
jgi:hypothetical protein